MLISFSEGSVKVLFRVIINVFKPSKETNDVVAVNVGHTIIKQLKTGRIGTLQVIPDAIQLQGNAIYIIYKIAAKISEKVLIKVLDVRRGSVKTLYGHYMGAITSVYKLPVRSSSSFLYFYPYVYFQSS